MKNLLLVLLSIFFTVNLVAADPQVFSVEDYEANISPTPPPASIPPSTPPPSSIPPSSPPPASVPPSSPPPVIDACAGRSIGELAGMIATKEHDGIDYDFNPGSMYYDGTRGIWVDNQGNSTFVCQKNSVPRPLGFTNVNLLYNFDWQRSGAGANDLAGRLNFADTFLAGLAGQQSCFVCGLVRFNTGCFPPGTLVTTADAKNTTVVEKVKVGDFLWNPISKKNSKVLAVVEGAEKVPLISITLGSIVLKLSSEHPVSTKAGLKQAKEISMSDVLLDGNGSERAISKIETLPLNQGQTVINFVMERTGNVHDGLILVEGIVVGDLTMQKSLVLDKIKE